MSQKNDHSILCISPKVIYGLQIATWGLILLDIVNIEVPLVRPLIFSVYLIFIPGYLTLKILKINQISFHEQFIYSIGLSISMLMFVGFFTNMVLLSIGYLQPLSTFPLLVSISFVVITMTFYCYKKDLLKKSTESHLFKHYISKFLCPEILVLVLFLFLIILYRIPYWQAFIPIYILLIRYSKYRINPQLYPLIITIIAISLLLHQSLSAKYLQGCDIHYEYHFFKIVQANNYWNIHIYSSLNSMLSVVILPTVLSKLMGVDAVWVYKIIYPLLFSLVPLGLYNIYKKQTNETIALLSTFFFISFFTFHGEMLSLPRQMIAELFFVLLLMLFIANNINRFQKSILALVFSFSLVVSHYAISYFYIYYLILICALGITINYYPNKLKIGKHLNFKIKTENRSAFSFTYVLLLIVFLIFWYFYFASGSTFITITTLLDRMFNTFLIEMFNSESRDPAVLKAIGAEPMKSLSMELARHIHRVTQLFIVVGSLSIIFNRTRMKFTQEYIYLIIGSLVLLLLCLVVPYFASSLNMTRIFHIVLLTLSPSCVIGGYTVINFALRKLNTLFNYIQINQKTYTKNKYLTNKDTFNNKTEVKIVTFILIVYFLSNVGIVATFLMDLGLDDTDVNQSPHLTIHDQDIPSSKWLSENTYEEYIYVDFVSRYILVDTLSNISRIQNYRPDRDAKEGYIFLNNENYITGNMKIFIYTAGSKNPLYPIEILENNTDKNMIYDNGDIIYKWN